MVSLVVPVNFTFAQSQTAQEQFPEYNCGIKHRYITPHLLKLKATQQGDAEPEKVGGF